MNALTLDPQPSAWAFPPPPDRSPIRAALGIPESTSVIMSGHQPEAWHPGIAAKFYLARALRDALCAAVRPAVVVWLTPDHVSAQPFRMATPVLEGGRLARGSVRVGPDLPDGASACASAVRRGLELTWEGGAPAIESVAAGAEAWRGALEGASSEANAARQAIAANAQLLGDPGAPDITLFASELAGARALDDLIDGMRADPEACARAYNDAAGARPSGGVGALEIGDRTELPLWNVRSGRPLRVFSDELGDIPREALAPRALTMTLLARRSLCEVFIHGTGGGEYDLVMEDWARRWLGETALAPMLVATTTRTLPLEHLAADEAEIDRAVWRAHAARHDPGMLGDESAAQEKRRLAERIESIRCEGGDASAGFHEMHELLKRVRTERAPELERLKRLAQEAERKRGTQGVLNERVWALALHDETVREELAAGAREAASEVTTPARSPR